MYEDDSYQKCQPVLLCHWQGARGRKRVLAFQASDVSKSSDALRFFSIAHERYLLAVAKESPLSLKSEIDLEDLRDEKIISFSRQNLSYSERYFAEKFEEHDLTDNVTYSCDDTFSLVSLVSAGLGIGFVPEWTQDLPNRGFELKKVRGDNRQVPRQGQSPVRRLMRVSIRVQIQLAWCQEIQGRGLTSQKHPNHCLKTIIFSAVISRAV
ncbi:hypothetical protein GCM10010520_50670 [Rhizobium viscosum]|uniref:DNA-binding transcriptional LysR family regulator n=1 Tax=Rhizobium viscosum TaxID=1673 RepID=A0ABR9IZH2_RHIVS|nr:DNA-binding transcriptional LysR family regulator [Rhizobium viscosum]